MSAKKRYLYGFLLLMSGAFLALSCLFYRAGDASLNSASSADCQHPLGSWGAVSSDLLFQTFGVLGYAIPIALCVFAFFMFKNQKWLKFRLTLFLTALILSCWLLGAHNNDLNTPINVQGAGFFGYYLTALIPVDIGWVNYLLWVLVAVLFVFSLKVPVFLICKYGSKTVVKHAQKVKLKKVDLKKYLPQKTKSVERIEPVFGDAPEKVDAQDVKKPKKSTPLPVKKESKKVLSKQNAFELPGLELLDPYKSNSGPALSKEAMKKIAQELEDVLTQFSIQGKILGASTGPVVTLYEYELAPGIKAARIISLADEVAMRMRVTSVRIAIIPGSNAIGIEVPNEKREIVYIKQMIENPTFQANKGSLPLILGKDIGGVPVFADLAKMPHLLVAGTTGSGKSVSINTMILSLLYRFTPDECKLIMVDPKMVELSVYNRIPHLLTPVVIDPEKAVVALKWAVREMEDRYRSMSHLGVRNIDGYNQKLRQAAQNGEVLARRVQTGFDVETGKPIFEEQPFDLTPIPFIVIIVDEMADLMIRCGKEVEPLIQRLAQMARAVGIHLILATQRPSVNVITGTIKSNFPSRMSFQVRNKIDSRTILDESGAEQLLGKGDMLFVPAGQKPQRIHCPFVSDDDVARVVKHWELQGEPNYLDAVLSEGDAGGASNNSFSGGEKSGDDLYDKAVNVVLQSNKPSISYVQRQLRIGYNKAADLIERMEQEGVVSAPNVSGKRDILVPRDNA